MGDARLGRIIGDEVMLGPDARHRGDIDHRPAGPAHQRYRVLAAKKRAEKIDIQLVPECVERYLLDRSICRDPCAIDENVQPAMPRIDLFEGGNPLIFHGHIKDDESGVRPHFLAQGLAVVSIDIGQNHGRTFCRKAPHNGISKPRGGTRYQCHLAFDPSRHFRPLRAWTRQFCFGRE